VKIIEYNLKIMIHSHLLLIDKKMIITKTMITRMMIIRMRIRM